MNIQDKNPLIRPLISYHQNIQQTFTKLPEEGKIFEITKRVLIVMVAPFAYLALSFTAILGLVIGRISKKEKGEIKEGSKTEKIVDEKVFEKTTKTNDSTSSIESEKTTIKKEERNKRKAENCTTWKDVESLDDQELVHYRASVGDSGPLALDTLNGPENEKKEALDKLFERLNKKPYFKKLFLEHRNAKEIELIRDRLKKDDWQYLDPKELGHITFDWFSENAVRFIFEEDKRERFSRASKHIPAKSLPAILSCCKRSNINMPTRNQLDDLRYSECKYEDISYFEVHEEIIEIFKNDFKYSPSDKSKFKNNVVMDQSLDKDKNKREKILNLLDAIR